jgi:hypothetical protein
MIDKAWDEYVAQIAKQVEILDKLSEELANLIPAMSTIEHKSQAHATLERFRAETDYYAKLLVDLKRKVAAA